MSDEDRKQTVQMPAAANAALLSERLSALERRFELGDAKLDAILRKLDALRDLTLEESRKREGNDEKLGRSLDRLDEKVMVMARDAEKQANRLGEVHALAMAAVDGTEATNRKLDELHAHGVRSAPGTPAAG